jgi:hypothetical protein
MKTLVRVQEVEGEGLVSLMADQKHVTLFCMNYIYTGRLVGVNDDCVKLEDASVVYETGVFTEAKWADAQKLPGAWYVQKSAIESFGVLK